MSEDTIQKAREEAQAKADEKAERIEEAAASTPEAINPLGKTAKGARTQGSMPYRVIEHHEDGSEASSITFMDRKGNRVHAKPGQYVDPCLEDAISLEHLLEKCEPPVAEKKAPAKAEKKAE